MARQLTQVYLDPKMKAGMQKRAKSRGTKVAEEFRNAVKAYLDGVGPEELKLLDMATVQAAKDLGAMAKRLDTTNKKLNEMFARLDRLEQQDKAAA